MAPTTLIVTVNLECCRCSSKIQKILCGIQQEGEFTIEKIVYEKDKVLVTGPFDADKLSSKLWCKAGRTIIKVIEVAKPKDEPKPKPEPPSCKLVYPYYPYPFQCPQPPGPWPCSCPHPHCGCQPKPQPPPPTPPPPPKPPACQCSTWPSCYCVGYPPYGPPPMPYPMVVCDDSPPYGACTVM